MEIYAKRWGLVIKFLVKENVLTHNEHAVFTAMVINAHVIDGSDPGAVPGGSTKKIWGRNRIDGRSKVLAFARRDGHRYRRKLYNCK